MTIWIEKPTPPVFGISIPLNNGLFVTTSGVSPTGNDQVRSPVFIWKAESWLSIGFQSRKPSIVGNPVTETKGAWNSVGCRKPPRNQAATVVPVVGVELGVAPPAPGVA